MQRYLSEHVEKLSQNKFLFIVGPRQVGKTTLVSQWTNHHNGIALNWDIEEEKIIILNTVFKKEIENTGFNFLALDEIHKYQKWKNALKGLADRKLKNFRLVVTGSARLDIFQKGGDSLLGRYEYLRLHPLSIGELVGNKFIAPPKDWLSVGQCSSDDDSSRMRIEILNRLDAKSGFPEPYFSDDELFYKRWSVRRKNLLLKEDIRDLSQIRLLSLLDQMMLLIPAKIGSPLSVNSLKQDIGVNHETVTTWLELLDRLYFTFRISTYSEKLVRSITKEKKLYLWDWASIADESIRYENMVAAHLLKSVHLWSDLGYGEFELQYLRNKEKKEIDFFITCDRKPVVAIECKLNDTSIADSWKCFEKISIPKIQLVKKQSIDRLSLNGIRTVSAATFLAGLN